MILMCPGSAASLQYNRYYYIGAIALGGSQFGDVTTAMAVGAVNCSGAEASLVECAHVASPVSCVGGATAGVVCQGIFYLDVYQGWADPGLG